MEADDDRMIVECLTCGKEWDMDYEPCPCTCDEPDDPTGTWVVQAWMSVGEGLDEGP